MNLFKEIADATAANIAEIEQHQRQQMEEIEKFNKLMDAWKLEAEANQY